MKTLVRNRVDTYMYVQNTTVEALKLPYWRQITHNLEHFFLSGAPFMDPEFFSEDQQVWWSDLSGQCQLVLSLLISTVIMTFT